MNNQKIEGLIQTFIRAKKAGDLDGELNYHELMDNCRKWQLENILDYEKLTHYSDAEFATKFGEMFDYSDGSATSHALNRGMHFKTNESRLAVRSAFENMVSFINNPDNDRFEIIEEILKPNSSFKVPGLGIHIVTTLVNAKYPDVPPINNTTNEFFKNIGEPLPAKLPEAERIVSQFFNDIVELSHGELNIDDANHIFWFSKSIESGRRYMEQNYAVTFENKVVHRKTTARKKVLTHDEQVAEIYAHLKAIQEQASREK